MNNDNIDVLSYILIFRVKFMYFFSGNLYITWLFITALSIQSFLIACYSAYHIKKIYMVSFQLISATAIPIVESDNF